jgi:signal transduction histidine kinase
MRTDNATSRKEKPLPTAQVAALVSQLQRSNEELNHFVRALSHDMGANLMLIEGSVSRLKRSLGAERAPQADEHLAHVEACLRQSRRLLNDMVELGRTGSVQVQPRRVELEAVLDEVLFEQRELLASRQVQVDVERPLPAFWCNEDRLKQIVVNLIRNAAIHGCDRQWPRIVVSTMADAPPGLVGFSIHDNGPGIERRFHEEIFLPGRRLAEASTEGSGMGLAIVRKIAGLYGGTVFLDPQGTSGTTFVVQLPRPAEAGHESPPPHKRGQPSAGLPPTRHPGHSPRPHRRLQGKLKRQGRSEAL